MNEIDKLKIEHARYKKVLETLNKFGAMTADTRRIIDCALNPPLPPPVTLEALMAAMHARNCRTGELLHITFFSDGSGRIGSYDRAHLFRFDSLQEALNHFTDDGNSL